jgi:hypothetical protein
LDQDQEPGRASGDADHGVVSVALTLAPETQNSDHRASVTLLLFFEVTT